MKVAAQCIPCYLDQALRALDQAEIGDEQQYTILNQMLKQIADLDANKSPAENSSLVMHQLVEQIGGKDPFKKAKEKSNRLALALYPQLQESLQGSEDPLYLALKYAVAGNIVDLGLFADYDLSKAVEDAIQEGFAIDHYPLLQGALAKAEQVLIIGDNSGEIVFDRLLVEELKRLGISVSYGVKDGFVINDATVEDAQAAGMSEVAQVVTNGNNYLGTVEEHCSEAFKTTFQQADVVISKGQANYESLEQTPWASDKTFFLLKAKCPLVARNLGTDYGKLVLVQNQI